MKIFELLHQMPTGTKPMDNYVNRDSGVFTAVPQGQRSPEAERVWKVN